MIVTVIIILGLLAVVVAVRALTAVNKEGIPRDKSPREDITTLRIIAVLIGVLVFMQVILVVATILTGIKIF